MELTGKCKIEFQKWYFKNHCKSSLKYKELMPHHEADVYGFFYGLNNSFKYGVYVDFFDSVGISITIEAVTSKMFNFRINRWGKEHCIVHGFKSRSETRTAAIEKADQIFNER